MNYTVFVSASEHYTVTGTGGSGGGYGWEGNGARPVDNRLPGQIARIAAEANANIGRQLQGLVVDSAINAIHNARSTDGRPTRYTGL